MRKFVAIVTIVVLLLLCGCRSTKVVERTDTITVERVVERLVQGSHSAGGSHSSIQWLHDTVTVVVERYDTAGRVMEKSTMNKGSKRGKAERDTIWQHDTLTVEIHDTIYIASSGSEIQSSNTTTVAEPMAWRGWVLAGLILAAIIGCLWLAWRRGKVVERHP